MTQYVDKQRGTFIRDLRFLIIFRPMCGARQWRREVTEDGARPSNTMRTLACLPLRNGTAKMVMINAVVFCLQMIIVFIN